MQKSDKLQSKIREILESLTPEDHQLWMSHPCTQITLLSLELDKTNLEESWALGQFDDRENLKAQGQAFYIMGMDQDMRHMLRELKNEG